MNNHNYNPYSSVPRTWLKIAQIAGTFFSVLGLVTYIFYLNDIYNSLPGNDFVKKSVTSLLLAIIIYFVWKSIYTAIIIVRLANKSSDEELCANRYIISALSLSLGGLLTPFLVTRFPNVDTTSTIKPRHFLSKSMGLCTLIGAPIFAISYFLCLILGKNAVNINAIFNPNSAMGIISISILAISFLTFILGLVTTKLFYSNKTENNFYNNNPSKLEKFISTIWMTILTIELILVIFFAIIRLIEAFLDLFRTREQGGGAIMMIFALLNFIMTISYVGMIIYVTTKTISGLWSLDGKVKIPKYKHNNYTEKNLSSNNAII